MEHREFRASVETHLRSYQCSHLPRPHSRSVEVHLGWPRRCDQRLEGEVQVGWSVRVHLSGEGPLEPLHRVCAQFSGRGR
jgi:hypothetical protein